MGQERPGTIATTRRGGRSIECAAASSAFATSLAAQNMLEMRAELAVFGVWVWVWEVARTAQDEAERCGGLAFQD